jgi:nitrate reductase delta subunit
MLVPARKGREHRQAVQRLRQWTRERFNLDDTSVVMAVQIACEVPGCPPIETVVAFWAKDGTRYRFKVFKPIAEVVYDDLPYGWLLQALIDDDTGLECC